MHKRAHTTLLVALALFLGIGLSVAWLNAQQPAPNPGQQSPGSQAQPQQPQGRIFAGTIVKSGDKYVLRDDSGTSYDIDRQDLVKKYEGQKVRITCTVSSQPEVCPQIKPSGSIPAIHSSCPWAYSVASSAVSSSPV
jgi:hypothetical protein